MNKSIGDILKNKNSKKLQAFTIIELLVVIVVIGILAAITIVSYSGITTRAKAVSLQSDLTNASKQLKMFYIDNGIYPATISTDCAINPTTTTNLCLKPSSDNNYISTPYSRPTPESFILTATNGPQIYYVTESSAPTAGAYTAPNLATTDPANWIQVGTQVWAKYNLNVGTRIAGATNQINNPGTNIVEKYCYGDTDAGCTNTDANGIPYGAFYQWDEAMGYSTAEKAQGICPAGSHIPSDVEWQVLEVQLGMAPGSDVGQVNNTGWRGTTQGIQLKSGGTSGLNIPLAGFRNNGGSFYDISEYAGLWSSSESGVNPWVRDLYYAQADVGRALDVKASGYSVRCIGN